MRDANLDILMQLPKAVFISFKARRTSQGFTPAINDEIIFLVYKCIYVINVIMCDYIVWYDMIWSLKFGKSCFAGCLCMKFLGRCLFFVGTSDMCLYNRWRFDGTAGSFLSSSKSFHAFFLNFIVQSAVFESPWYFQWVCLFCRCAKRVLLHSLALYTQLRGKAVHARLVDPPGEQPQAH